jgi:hypothetical protein
VVELASPSRAEVAAGEATARATGEVLGSHPIRDEQPTDVYRDARDGETRGA